MALESSEEEEQGDKEEAEADTVAPAAPERQQDVGSASAIEDRKEKIRIAIRKLRHHNRCFSDILEGARQRRFTVDLLLLRHLSFMAKELSYIVACLTTLRPQHLDDDMMAWLHELTSTETKPPPHLIEANQASQTTLLRTAALCFCSGRSYDYELQLVSKFEFCISWDQRWKYYPTAARFYRVAEDPRWYKHLITYGFYRVTQDLRHGLLPTQAADEGGGLHSVGADWFERSSPPSCDFPYEINLPTLYMTMFPCGYKFDRDRLITKWSCEGIYGVGKCDDLFDQNVITRAAPSSRRNKPDEAEAWQWNVDHLQYQLLASKSAEMGFVFTSDTLNILAAASETDHVNETPGMIARRLALHQDDPNIPSLLQKIDLSQTRSLAVSGAVSGVRADKFVNLVVLDVEGWENFDDDDLLRLCRSKISFLKYLSIRNTRVSMFPSEMKELFSLKILDASYTQVTNFQLEVFEGTELHLHSLDLSGTPIRQLTLPKQFHLYDIILGGEGIDLREQPASFVKALGALKRLRVLAITWSYHQSTDRGSCQALLSSIKSWTDLQSLTFHCGIGCSMEFLDSLSDPPQRLEKFKVIAGRFAVVPQWFRGLVYLSFVQITVCKLDAQDLETLRNLPAMKCLVLGLDFIPRKAIVLKNEGFHMLQKLFINCPLPWLTFVSGVMPKLTYLQLDFGVCPMNPTHVPSGISNLCSLKEVSLWYNVRYMNSTSVKVTVEAIRKEVAKHRNTSQVIGLFINGIEQDDVQAVDEETENAKGAPSGTDAGAEDAVQAVDEFTAAAVQSEITEAES